MSQSIFQLFLISRLLSGGNQSETGLLAICKHGLGLFCRKAPWGTFGEHDSRRMVHIAQRGTTHEPQTFDLYRSTRQVFLITKLHTRLRVYWHEIKKLAVLKLKCELFFFPI